MWRLLAGCCVLLVGCDFGSSLVPDPEGHTRDAPLANPDGWPAEIQAAIDAGSASWPKATEKPIEVRIENALSCVGNPNPEDHGPHFVPHIVVRTNPEAMKAFRELKSPMPVGTVILKEKYSTAEVDAAPESLGAMIKREAGYDPESGDWEYLFGDYSAGAKVERGRLANCIACHSAYAKENDYLFRTYSWMWEVEE